MTPQRVGLMDLLAPPLVETWSGEKLAPSGVVRDQHEVRIEPHLLKPTGARPVREDEDGAGIVGGASEARQVVAQYVRNLVKSGLLYTDL